MAAQPELADKIPPGARVAFITGSSRGIGRGIALRLAQDGLDVVISDVPSEKEKAELTSQEIKDMGRKSMVQLVDVTKLEDLEKAYEQIISEFGRLDVIVANAGITGPLKGLIDCTPEEIDGVFKVNVMGVFKTITAGAKVLIKQGFGGRVLVTASITAYKPEANGVPYASTKFAVRSLVQGAAQEWAKYGIRVNCYAPGYIETQLLDSVKTGIADSSGVQKSAFDNDLKSRVLLGRLGTPEDIGKVASFLVSPESEYMTGQTLAQDGGVIFT